MIDATGIIMAVSGTVVGVGGLVLSRRGQKDEAVQEAAATKLADRVQGYNELAAYTDRIEKQLEKATAALTAQEVTADRRRNEQSQRCRAALSSAMDTLHTLQAVVRAEISKEAAHDAIDEAGRHLAVDHPEEP